jgi:serine/threonine-protein kinase 10
MQREEQKEAQAFSLKMTEAVQGVEKKYDIRKTEMKRSFENAMEQMKKRQKKELEKLDSSLEGERKLELKKTRQTQMKDLKSFQSELKQEEKELEKSVKEEVQSVPKVERKSVLRRKLSDYQGQMMERETSYKNQLGADFAQLENALSQKHKDEKRSMELKCMLARHDLIRQHQSNIWELEQNKLTEKNQWGMKHLKEAFMIHRRQMENRHKMESIQQERLFQLKSEDMKQRHLLEKRRYPKQVKAECKAQLAEVRKRKGDVRQADMELDQVYKDKIQEMMDRQKQEEMVLEHETKESLQELVAIQKEKKDRLDQMETDRMRDKDGQHAQEMREWKSSLSGKKSVSISSLVCSPTTLQPNQYCY